MFDFDLEKINKMYQNTMVDHLGIIFTESDHLSLAATMPVDHRTCQPMRILHGGASVALAESIGSIASVWVTNDPTKACVGLEINANHIRGVKTGNIVKGIATAIHIGRLTHIWNINILNEEGKLVCVSRLTVAIVDQK